MNEIIEILMARDGISKEDAIDVIDNCKEEIDAKAQQRQDQCNF